MFGIGWSELLIIVVVLLLVFGTTRLPQLGEAMGKSIKNFQKAMKGEEDKKDGSKTDGGSKTDKPS